MPSIFVQLFWTALVGPWILWKIRRVNDVHSWAWQTRLAIIAGYVIIQSLYLRDANCGRADYPARLCGWRSPTASFQGCTLLINSFPQQAGKCTFLSQRLRKFRNIFASGIDLQTLPYFLCRRLQSFGTCGSRHCLKTKSCRRSRPPADRFAQQVYPNSDSQSASAGTHPTIRSCQDTNVATSIRLHLD